MTYQMACLKEMDNLVNMAIMEDSKKNFGKFQGENIEIKTILNEILPQFQMEGDCKKYKFEKPLIFQQFTEINLSLAKNLCNQAHEVQNLCAFYNHKAPENTFTNKIINLAGQIEDNSRKIQDVINNHKPKVMPNKKDYATNFYSTIIGISDKVHTFIKQIEDLTIEEACPIKITNDSLHKLLSNETNLADTIKQNMLIGYFLEQ